jgi:hypothetical protein
MRAGELAPSSSDCSVWYVFDGAENHLVFQGDSVKEQSPMS